MAGGQEEKKKKKFHFPFRSKKKKSQEKSVIAPAEKSGTTAPPKALPRIVKVNSEKRTKENGVEASARPQKKEKKLKASWLARRKFFVKMADQAFELVDADGSGDVDEKELYSGLLLIHLKLGCYAGPAACRPVGRERVHDIFEKMDVDDSGSLDRTEFREYILNLIDFLWNYGLGIIMHLDDHSVIFDAIEIFVEDTRDKIIELTPNIIKSVFGVMAAIIQKVPDSVWNTVPLTLLSCILGCIAVPWMLFKIDDYFQHVAHKKVN